jgi:hypothetical protein
VTLTVVTINKDLSVLFSLRPELCPASFLFSGANLRRVQLDDEIIKKS